MQIKQSNQCKWGMSMTAYMYKEMIAGNTDADGNYPDADRDAP